MKYGYIITYQKRNNTLNSGRLLMNVFWKKAKTVPSVEKIMTTNQRDSKGIILIDYMEKGKKSKDNSMPIYLNLLIQN